MNDIPDDGPGLQDVVCQGCALSPPRDPRDRVRGDEAPLACEHCGKWFCLPCALGHSCKS